ncbi:hypothetical protein L1277_001408 [Okibacterium sp. HSC-33S16]|uniref:hypothetical protein n=1 Tax=Okibacterium sp. HSC-33S16 TaxID=2910965 RepID=UPI00209CAE72|nr:hypothetical protein [Okibacterium sp. HSC-33S16]MCP2031317.1 hypothetical protein [Okibacterium sp. HSC-33S16]
MTIFEAPAAKPVLEILAISDHEWRVCDGRFQQSDARRMLGYIDRTADVYELVRLRHRAPSMPPVERFTCLKDALDALVEFSGKRW